MHGTWKQQKNNNNNTGFDEYYKSLRPRLSPEDCTQMFVNQRHPRDPKLQINCRNIWFNEFWSQHHKCSFAPDERLPRCTGNETLTNYEQEGLVPFVGKWILFPFFRSFSFPFVFSFAAIVFVVIDIFVAGFFPLIFPIKLHRVFFFLFSLTLFARFSSEI